MRNSISILTFAFFLACTSQEDKKSTVAESSDSSAMTNRRSERFFPEKKTTEIFDTLIADSQVQISIKKTYLDSYVSNEYEEEGNKQVDKYRDAEITLVIEQNSEILLDTVLKKEQFLNYADQEFMDIAIFHNYWFKKLDKDKIELFGVISKPETDYSLAFYHYLHLANKKLEFVEYIEEEE